MIHTSDFYRLLSENGFSFFSGVPDSLLKDICAYITDNTTSEKHIIAANEGAAVALASGYHLATGAYPVVYMQNSGLGNAVNPLLSLADAKVYSIPLLLLVGWRGEPGVKDEPQHIKQGEITSDLLEAMKIPHAVLSGDVNVAEAQMKECVNHLKTNNSPYALVIRKNTFEPYSLKSKDDGANDDLMSREDAISAILDLTSERDIIVSTTGMTSREVFEYRERNSQTHAADFLTVGSMGHASQIALTIANEKKERRVICLDGDGATIMHMGSLAIIGKSSPKNYIHIVLNNAAHDSVGGQPTVADNIDLPAIALACGYTNACSVTTNEEITAKFKEYTNRGTTLIEIKVRKGARKDLGRPTTTPLENKAGFMNHLKEF
ncbi:phosphonopyruvate decarboxylase [Paludibacter sp.]